MLMGKIALGFLKFKDYEALGVREDMTTHTMSRNLTISTVGTQKNVVMEEFLHNEYIS